jgi:hypothetical protein
MRHSRPALWPLLAAKDATAERVTTKKDAQPSQKWRSRLHPGGQDAANRDLW